jgi:hypothetical protein
VRVEYRVFVIVTTVEYVRVDFEVIGVGVGSGIPQFFSTQ